MYGSKVTDTRIMGLADQVCVSVSVVALAVRRLNLDIVRTVKMRLSTTGSGQGQEEKRAGIQRRKLSTHAPRLTNILELWDWTAKELSFRYAK